MGDEADYQVSRMLGEGGHRRRSAPKPFSPPAASLNDFEDISDDAIEKRVREEQEKEAKRRQWQKENEKRQRREQARRDREREINELWSDVEEVAHAGKDTAEALAILARALLQIRERIDG